MLEIKNFEELKGKMFGDWRIYQSNERNDHYEFYVSGHRGNKMIGLIITLSKEQQANKEYRVTIQYQKHGNVIYNETWEKGGFDTIQQFLTNVGLIVSNYEKGLKTK